MKHTSITALTLFLFTQLLFSGCKLFTKHESPATPSSQSGGAPNPQPPPSSVPTPDRLGASAPTSIQAGTCQEVTVTTRDTTGPLDVLSDTVVLFSGATFFSDSACTSSALQTTFPSGTHLKSVYIKPTLAQELTLTFSSTGLTSASVSVSVTGTALLIMSPSSYTFSSQLVGTTAYATFTVSNTGTATASSLSFSSLSNSFGMSGGSCGSSLGVGSSCTVSVSFSPTTASTFASTLLLTYSNSQTPQSVSSSLAGTGNHPGALDTSFSTVGYNLVAFSPNTSTSNHDYGYAGVLQPDGKLVVAGYTYRSVSPINYDVAIARYQTNGNLDTGFGTQGKASLNFGSHEYGRAIKVQTDGKLLVGGYGRIGSQNQFQIVRVNTNGALDTTFGTQGRALTSFSAGGTIYSLERQADGKVLGIGYASHSGSAGFTIARYLTNGALDTSFATQGTSITTFSTAGAYATASALQSDGKLLVSGYATGSGGTRDFAIVRYRTDGGLDTSFGTQGRTFVDFGATDTSYGITLQGDGKAVIVGSTNPNSDSNFALTRLLTNGTLDTAFGTQGRQSADFGTLADIASGVALQSDGKLVVSGYHSDFLIARFQSNGTLDTLFKTTGKVVTGIGPAYDYAQSVLLQNDGKIVVSGFSYNGSNYDFAIARYLP